MKDQSDFNPKEVISHFRETVPNSPCADACEAQYEKDLDACDGDIDCINRVTGKYVLCVIKCKNRKAAN